MPASWLSGAGGSCRVVARRTLLAGVLSVVAVVPSAIQPIPTAAAAPGLATVVSETPLLAGPEPDAEVLADLGAGIEVVLSGSAAPGYLAVSVDGRSGWVAAQDLSLSNRVGIPLEDAEEQTSLLAAPMAEAEVLGTVPAGGVVILTGANVGGYVAGSYEGTGGWISEEALGMPYDDDQTAS